MGGVPIADNARYVKLAERSRPDELERRHAAGYLRQPPDHHEDAWAEMERGPSGVADDVDWAGLYGVSRPK